MYIIKSGWTGLACILKEKTKASVVHTCLVWQSKICMHKTNNFKANFKHFNYFSSRNTIKEFHGSPYISSCSPFAHNFILFFFLTYLMSSCSWIILKKIGIYLIIYCQNKTFTKMHYIKLQKCHCILLTVTFFFFSLL